MQGEAGTRGIINLPALLILLIITMALIKGTQESAMVNAVIVFIKVSIVLVFIVIGWGFINPVNHILYFVLRVLEGTQLSWLFNHGWVGSCGAQVSFSLLLLGSMGIDCCTGSQESK